jgi:glycerol-3-phosphate dehydrogenase (NAD(P)+)
MKIAFLGCGCWGYCLASLLAAKGHQIVSWTSNADLAEQLQAGQEHPALLGYPMRENMSITTDMASALEDAELIVESVTSAGLRPVVSMLAALGPLRTPFVITSKGIEQGSGLILPEVVVEVCGVRAKSLVALLSGPGFAGEVIAGLPTTVVSAAWDAAVMQLVCQTFSTSSFKVYPNSDIVGVAYGGALKNIIAIACGISDGLSLGSGAKAALMTRGLHEMRKLAVACGCRAETLNGLSGMGDMSLTCGSMQSRNTRFGEYIAEGYSVQEALNTIGMVVEGAYTCVSARELSRSKDVAMPITELVYSVLYEGLAPFDAVSLLMQRAVKEEHL